MMDVKILELSQTQFSSREIVMLISRAFKCWTDKGLVFHCSTYTCDEYEERYKNSIRFVATVQNEKGEHLVGIATLFMARDKKNTVLGDNGLIAVDPLYKNLGIGSMLIDKVFETCVLLGGQYIISDTSVEASDSVMWHIKNGFSKYSLVSFSNTSYYSYIFYKKLGPKSLNHFCISIHYLLSFIKTKVVFDKSGSLTNFGKLLNVK